jgi:hypothetical protein
MREREKLLEKVNKDFPCDPNPALQEVHYAHLKIHDYFSMANRTASYDYDDPDKRLKMAFG